MNDENTSWKTIAMNFVFIVPFLDQRTCIGTTVILVFKLDNICFFFNLHLLFFIQNKLIVYLLLIERLKTIMFMSYSSSQVLKLISVDHYMKSFHVHWTLGEILEKAGYWKNRTGCVSSISRYCTSLYKWHTRILWLYYLVIKTNEFALDLTVKSRSNMDTLVQWTCYQREKFKSLRW